MSNKKYKIAGVLLLAISIICTIINIKLLPAKEALTFVIMSAIFGISLSIVMFFMERLYELEEEKILDGKAHPFTLKEETRFLYEKSPYLRRTVGNIACISVALFPVYNTIIFLLININK